MNKLPTEKRIQVLHMLCEGSSMRSISRVAGVSINTVSKLLEDAGEACDAFHNDTVRNVQAKRVQCDEIWSFCYSKQKNVPQGKESSAGDLWTWTALDSDSKMILSWLVGGRDSDTALDFVADLKGRLANRIQLTTDGHEAYLEAIEGAFGDDVDYAQLIKLYGETVEGQKRYSPAQYVSAKQAQATDNPAPRCISTLNVAERSNLTMRRFTRLTSGFSKKIINYCHALSLYFVWYNFVRMHKSLKMPPAMAAGVSDTPWSMEDLVEMIDIYTIKKKRLSYSN
jgi:IS1 family transposase